MLRSKTGSFRRSQACHPNPKVAWGLVGGAVEQSGDFAKKPNMSARIGVKLLGGLLGAVEHNGDFAKKPNMSARIGVKLLGGLLGGAFGAKRGLCEEAKHVSQDWGKVAWGLVGGAAEQNGDFAKKPNMSARIGVKLLGCVLVGAFGAKRGLCEEDKHVSQDWAMLLGDLLGVLWSKTGKCTSTNQGPVPHPKGEEVQKPCTLRSSRRKWLCARSLPCRRARLHACVCPCALAEDVAGTPCGLSEDGRDHRGCVSGFQGLRFSVL